jgi:ABC-type proline/glycine betaine transport system permease subunit
MARAEPKLACRGLWKLYGPGAEALLANRAAPGLNALRAAGVAPAVMDASLEVAAGESFVIMELSGSGKSTLVRCLSRLIEPSAGAIAYEGRDLRAMPERDLIALRRRHMGMVFQHFALLPHLSVLDNVAFPLLLQGAPHARREARAREMSDARLGPVGFRVIDTLQTLPSFVYLIPVVMLFRVGEFTAMIAIVLYAVAPAIRYAALGVRGAPAELIEAATAMGATGAQRVLRVRLPLALPAILLGLNQTILLAISMLVITALVGTRDLGQDVYAALARADMGAGLTSGACIAMIALIADRLTSRSAERARSAMGLAP